MSFFKERTEGIHFGIKHHSDPDFYIPGEKVGADFFLKKTHSYYAQVEGQLALTGSRGHLCTGFLCIFVRL